MKPMNKVKIGWSPEFSYALGLLVTDGNLSPDGRHFDFTSNDREQLKNLMKCLGIKVKISYKMSGYTNKMRTRIQFGDVNFYKFLLGIGFMPAKTKIIARLKIPDSYFFDFIRGHFDGDGTFYAYWDIRWKNSFMFYTELTSASEEHIIWIQDSIIRLLGVTGRITKSVNNSVYRLKYAKAGSLKLLRQMYYNGDVVCLSRKRLKIEKALSEVNIHL